MTTFTFDVELFYEQGERYLPIVYQVEATKAQLRSITVEDESIAGAWASAKAIIDRHLELQRRLSGVAS